MIGKPYWNGSIRLTKRVLKLHNCCEIRDPSVWPAGVLTTQFLSTHVFSLRRHTCVARASSPSALKSLCYCACVKPQRRRERCSSGHRIVESSLGDFEFYRVRSHRASLSHLYSHTSPIAHDRVVHPHVSLMSADLSHCAE